MNICCGDVNGSKSVNISKFLQPVEIDYGKVILTVLKSDIFFQRDKKIS